MTRRRSDDNFSVLWDLLMVSPWWVGPVMAAIAYVGLACVLPPLLKTNQFVNPLSGLPRIFAPFAAAGILLISLFVWLKRWSGGLLLNRQSGVDAINILSWREFEELIAAAYRRQGYQVIETGGGGADGGIDLILLKDGVRVLVQCKHWRSSQVGVKLVRELHGITCSKEYAGSHGAFVTFGTYTQDAKTFAQENDIELVDRKDLLAMIESVRRTRATQDVPDVASVTNTADAADEQSQSCPLCGSPMIIRAAKKGSRAGSKFWGYSCYPACRGTRDC